MNALPCSIKQAKESQTIPSNPSTSKSKAGFFAYPNVRYRALSINDEFIGVQAGKILTLLIW